MMKLLTAINATFNDEQALIDIETNEVLLRGEYDDKIGEMIAGFLSGLSYAGIEYEGQGHVFVKPSNKLFEVIGFNNHNY